MQANGTKNNDVDNLMKEKSHNTKFDTKNQSNYC